MTNKLPIEQSKSIDQFLAEVKEHPLQAASQNRLIFAMDATASREPMWDLASNLHAKLFEAAGRNELAVQLVHFGGFQQFHYSAWSVEADQLLRQMQSVHCLGGITQIERVLQHILHESTQSKQLKAAVYVGDMCEESITPIASLSGQLGLRQIPVFVFQEGRDGYATEVFRSIATRSGGAHMPFDANSSDELSALLSAVAVYATKGYRAVRQLKTTAAQRLISQVKHP